MEVKMKHASRQIAVLLFASILWPGGAFAQAASDEQQIRDLEQQWADAVAERDLEAIVGLFAEGGQIMPPNAKSVTGREPIAEAWQGILDLPELEFSFAPTAVNVSESGDMAYVIGTYQLAYKGEEARVEDVGKYVDVWEKIDGEWKVVIETYNSDLPRE
jgi:uncharacterized protein (TIGR02246 family)